ncbi:MAG: hypothetical protein WC489_04650 [Patescibacteria group bacterium]
MLELYSMSSKSEDHRRRNEFHHYLTTLGYPFRPPQLGQALYDAVHIHDMGGNVVSETITRSRRGSEHLIITLIEGRHSQPLDGTKVHIAKETDPEGRKNRYDMEAGQVLINRDGEIVWLENRKRYISPRTSFVVDGKPTEARDLRGEDNLQSAIHLLVPSSVVEAGVHDHICTDIFAGQPGINYSRLGVDYEPESGEVFAGPGSVLRPTRLFAYPHNRHGDVLTYVNQDPAAVQYLVEHGVFPEAIDGVATVERWLYAPLEPGLLITPETFLVPAHA